MTNSPALDVESAGGTDGFGGLSAKLNWLRAGVLGANDGVVSGAGITIGVAAVNPENLGAIVLAGVAGLLAGASAMAMGEYVSVSSQRDTEEALIAKERHDLEQTPELEFEELVGVYRRQGLSDTTARAVSSRSSPITTDLPLTCARSTACTRTSSRLRGTRLWRRRCPSPLALPYRW